MKAHTAAGLALALAAILTPPAHAQAFPSGPLRIILTNPPGVPNDTLARGMLESLAKTFGQKVFIDNRIGADGIIGADACAKAAPDGHTICSSTAAVFSVNAVLRQKLPYDPHKDFAGVAFLGFFDSVLTVHPSITARNVQELLEAARAKPESMVWGHFGVNTTGNFYQEWFRNARGARFHPVPYKTTSQTLQAVLTGEAQVMVFSWPQLLPHLKSGKVRALAITSDKRLPFLPDVPTFEETGIKLPLRGWFGYHAPAAVPRPVILRWNTEIRKVAAEPWYQEKFMAPLGMSGSNWSPEELDAFLRNHIRDMAELMKTIGIKPE